MLTNKISIYVPSTYRDKEAPENVINYYVNDTLKKLAAMFGGATMTTGRGAYVAQDNTLIIETVYICFAYCEDYNKNELVSICENLKTVFQQEAISLEINNTLEFV